MWILCERTSFATLFVCLFALDLLALCPQVLYFCENMNRIHRISLPPLPPIIRHRMDQQRFGAAGEPGPPKRQMPAIFKLNIDCFAKIFDYLSLVELINVAQTCKLLHKVCGHIFQLHYPFANVIVGENGEMHLENHREVNECVVTFSEYIRCVVFSEVLNDNPSPIEWQQFKSLKRVNFYCAKFNEKKLGYVKDLLKNAEIVELSDCGFFGTTFEQFLDACENIKNLTITISYDYNENWFNKNYPHLETVSIVPIVYYRQQIYELSEFFKQNANVSKFFMSSKFLLDNRAFIMQAKFDQLKVQVDAFDFSTIRNVMNVLHANGVYKRFYITFFDCFKFTQSFIDQMNSINALVGLKVPFNTTNLDLSGLGQLEVLRFDCDVDRIINMSELTQNLANLREISFVTASIDDVLPFACRLPKLKKIAVEKLVDFWRDIDLLAVNEQRRKLFESVVHVSQVIIYIPEMAYLRIRKKFLTMSLEFVAVLRYELYDTTRF